MVQTTHGARLSAPGGPEALVWEPIDLPAPRTGEVLVEVAAAGVNYIDVYQRNGLYPLPLPAVLGLEGAGTVTAVGPDVVDLAPGDRVAWLDVPGSYAGAVLAPAARLVRVPDGLDLELAAAAMLQGATAHYLITDTYPLRAGETALVHAAAGGVGLLLVQMARAAGARVLATAGTPEKAALARGAGAHEVVLYRDEDVVAGVEHLVGAHAVDVVYDGVGAATFEASLDVLRPRGMLVSFGNASGPVPPVAPITLSRKGSLYLTRPTLAHYVATTEELRRRAETVLGGVAAGTLQVRIGLRLPMEQVARAHERLEARQTTGKVVLQP
jgi:NADPH2:quinone reductase